MSEEEEILPPPHRLSITAFRATVDAAKKAAEREAAAERAATRSNELSPASSRGGSVFGSLTASFREPVLRRASIDSSDVRRGSLAAGEEMQLASDFNECRSSLLQRLSAGNRQSGYEHKKRDYTYDLEGESLEGRGNRAVFARAPDQRTEEQLRLVRGILISLAPKFFKQL